MDWIVQSITFVFGATGILLVGSKRADIMRWGYPSGLIGNLAFYITFAMHDQWILCVANVVYTASWIHGIYTHREVK